MNHDLLFPCEGGVCHVNIFIHDEEFYEYFDSKHHRTAKPCVCFACRDWFDRRIIKGETDDAR